MSPYNKVKTGFYATTLIITVIAIFIGPTSSHMPAYGFILPILFGFTGVIWIIIDWTIAVLTRDINFDYSIHRYGIGINFIMVLAIYISN